MLTRSPLGRAAGLLILLLFSFVAVVAQAVKPDAVVSQRKIERYLGKLEKIGINLMLSIISFKKAAR